MVKNYNFLVDTHIFLWWLSDDKKLPKKVRSTISNTENTIFVSVASVWEVAIKKTIGKLRVPNILHETLETSGFSVLPIELSHVLQLMKLPYHHKDPFDRILVAQAIVEQMTLISTNQKISQYNVVTLRM